jgi:hypothetical protein
LPSKANSDDVLLSKRFLIALLLISIFSTTIILAGAMTITNGTSIRNDQSVTANAALVNAFASVQKAEEQGASNTSLTPLVNNLNLALQYENTAEAYQNQGNLSGADTYDNLSTSLSNEISHNAMVLGMEAQQNILDHTIFSYGIAVVAAIISTIFVMDFHKIQVILYRLVGRKATWRKAKRSLVVFLMLLITFTIIFASITFYLISSPPSQPFMAFGIYSSDGGLQGYGTNSTIIPGQTFSWYMLLTNHMSTAQFAEVVVRIGNQTTPSPNSTTPLISYPPLITMGQFVGAGATARFNFTWTLESLNQTGTNVLANLIINGNNVNSAPVQTASGHSFRLIFELWTYDFQSGGFLYGYGNQTSSFGVTNSREGSWLQIWFNPA